jgi:hypothetical protein
MVQFPEIEDIRVWFDGYDNYEIKRYYVSIGISPDNMKKVNREDIKKKVNEYCSYMLNSNKESIKILFYNPEDF